MDIKNTKEVKKESKINHSTFPESSVRTSVAGWVTPEVKSAYIVTAADKYGTSPSTLTRVLIEALTKDEITICSKNIPTSDLDKRIIADINVYGRHSFPLKQEVSEALFSVKDKYPSARDFIVEGATNSGYAKTHNVMEMIISKDTDKVFSVALYRDEDYYNTKTPLDTVYFDSTGKKFISIAGKHDTLFLDEGTETLIKELYIINHPDVSIFTASLMKTTEEYCADLIEETNAIDLLST